jgi:hypothetical protein
MIAYIAGTTLLGAKLWYLMEGGSLGVPAIVVSENGPIVRLATDRHGSIIEPARYHDTRARCKRCPGLTLGRSLAHCQRQTLMVLRESAIFGCAVRTRDR